MKLKIGLTTLQPGWEIILKQEGLNFEEISLDDPVNVDDCSVLIINEQIYQQQKKHLYSFLKNGGTAIINSEIFANFNNLKLHSKTIEYCIPNTNSIFADIGLIDFYTRFHWLKSKEIQYLDSNLKIQFQQIGEGYLLLLPFDVNSLILNTDVKRKKILVDRKELPSEIVAKVSKGKIRQIISRCFRFLYDKRNIPFIQLGKYPNNWQNLFMFRVDTDFCSAKEAIALYKLCKKHKIKGTWFVDTVSKETIQHVYCKMTNQEIALHCRRHLVFPDYETNKENIENGLNDLQVEGIDVTGFAAPFGEWNENLAKVLEEKNFQYSSEFCLNYDDLPFYPVLNQKNTSVLQIAIHPMSTGRMRRSHFSKTEMWEYYKDYIEECIKIGSPIFIYHHPSHGNLKIIEKVFEFINENKINVLTYQEYADWWEKRDKFKIEMNYNDNELSCEIDKIPEDIFLRITKQDEFALVGINKKINLKDLNWQKIEKLKLKSNLKRIRKWHWRDTLYNYESKKGKKNK
ncbi:MAG: hypothetical protein J7K29_04310, partial [Candidatus Cloacimonetes bacterium]|nr:hypothetical protein [Candidatus Cloacimonadota bacterium]